MTQDNPKVVIGPVEIVSFPEVGIGTIHARVDTGAQTSAIWASKIDEKDGILSVVFFAKGHPHYTGKTHYFDDFTLGMVASSNGHTEMRYKVKTLVVIAGKKIRARLTLADRSTQVYPVLMGRNVLRGKFIVDVKLATSLREDEKSQSNKLQAQTKTRSAK